MGNHKKRRPANRRAGCLLCRPYKANGVKKRKFKINQSEYQTGTWGQEARAQLGEEEQISELGLVLCVTCEDTGCVWCGFPCPVGEHEVGPSDLEGAHWVSCSKCGSDGQVINGKVEW